VRTVGADGVLQWRSHVESCVVLVHLDDSDQATSHVRQWLAWEHGEHERERGRVGAQRT
jgi:hypothetical protein